MTVNTFLILHVHKSTITLLQQKAENEGTMCMSHLNISMIDTQILGLNGEMLALVLEVSVSMLGRIRDWLILLWLFSLPPGKHSGSTSNIPRHFRVTIFSQPVIQLHTPKFQFIRHARRISKSEC